MAFAPNGDIALVGNSIDLVQDGSALKQVPDDRIYVIDMKANPPKLAATIKAGKQPSGLSFSPSGNMALVAARTPARKRSSTTRTDRRFSCASTETK
jgi:hypothetical protein